LDQSPSWCDRSDDRVPERLLNDRKVLPLSSRRCGELCIDIRTYRGPEQLLGEYPLGLFGNELLDQPERPMS
jgi:hypothetical protein